MRLRPPDEPSASAGEVMRGAAGPLATDARSLAASNVCEAAGDPRAPPAKEPPGVSGDGAVTSPAAAAARASSRAAFKRCSVSRTSTAETTLNA